jgi:hypothetical protein
LLWPARRPALSVVALCAMFQLSLCRMAGCVFTMKVLLSTAATNCALSYALSAEKSCRYLAQEYHLKQACANQTASTMLIADASSTCICSYAGPSARPQRHGLRMLSQAKGSPSDSIRRRQTPGTVLDLPDAEEVTGSDPVRPTHLELAFWLARPRRTGSLRRGGLIARLAREEPKDQEMLSTKAADRRLARRPSSCPSLHYLPIMS